MKFDNVFYINGTAYAGKSTMVKMLEGKYNGIACEENYQDTLLDSLDKKEFPCLTYTRDLKDWSEFIRKTPDEYETWVDGCNRECAILELRILEKLSQKNKPIFVDTNIPVEVLKEISDIDHVVIMLVEPDISVNRFFERPDKEKQFLSPTYCVIFYYRFWWSSLRFGRHRADVHRTSALCPYFCPYGVHNTREKDIT